MTQLINVKPEDCISQEKAISFCRELEKGNILFFLKTPFSLLQNEIDFLLSRKAKRGDAIVCHPESGIIKNPVKNDAEQMLNILSGYSTKVSEFLSQLLPSYAPRWKSEWTCFRPFQKRLDANHEKLQVDAFSSRPLHGSRVLRFFTNIHPTEGKRWVTSKSFAELAQEFAGKVLPFPKSCTYSLGRRLERKMKEFLASGGLKIALRSPYDQFMLKMQRFLKQNAEFQNGEQKTYWDFPPGACWAFFSDQVSHAALSNRAGLEQIFLIPNQAMLYPDFSPVSILERLSKGNMVNPMYASAN